MPGVMGSVGCGERVHSGGCGEGRGLVSGEGGRDGGDPGALAASLDGSGVAVRSHPSPTNSMTKEIAIRLAVRACHESRG